MLKKILLLTFLSVSTMLNAQEVTFSEQVKFNPNKYVCYKTQEPIVVDGKMDEKVWKDAPWTEYFADIEGYRRVLEPRFKTRAKMLWDDKYLYIAAYLEDTDVWATLTERESVIFRDNDFEVFLDPNGDTHHYMEFEMNAFATEWDLMLTRPYRDAGCRVLDNWNMNGVKSAVFVDGTINDGSDIDKGWSVEIAIPLDALNEPDGKKPAEGVQWRINFSRVEWFSKWNGEKYEKIPNEYTGKTGNGAEDNWVWSPQGVVAMHQPETWGFLQFSEKNSGKGVKEFVWNKNEDVKWALRLLYFRMRELENVKSIDELRPEEVAVEGLEFKPELRFTRSSWEISVEGFDGKRVYITSNGRTWVE